MKNWWHGEVTLRAIVPTILFVSLESQAQQPVLKEWMTVPGSWSNALSLCLLLSPATGKLQAVQQCTQPAACCFPWRPFVSPQRWEDVNDSASSGILSRAKYPYREQKERREAQMHLYEEGIFCHPMQQHPRLAPLLNRSWVDRRQRKTDHLSTLVPPSFLTLH